MTLVWKVLHRSKVGWQIIEIRSSILKNFEDRGSWLVSSFETLETKKQRNVSPYYRLYLISTLDNSNLNLSQFLSWVKATRNAWHTKCILSHALETLRDFLIGLHQYHLSSHLPHGNHYLTKDVLYLNIEITNLSFLCGHNSVKGSLFIFHWL